MKLIYPHKANRPARNIIAGLFCFLMANGALALDPDKAVYQFNCQNWDRQSGLPSDKINAITQTGDGYIWFGTQNGLVRFDGFEFKNIPRVGSDAGRQEIKSLVSGGEKGLWMAINGSGFESYDGQKFQPVGDEAATVANPNANVVLEGRSGVLWGGSDTGLSYWSRDHTNGVSFEETNLLVISLAEDPAGRIWMGTAERGLWCWINGRLSQAAGGILEHRNLYVLAADRNGQIWVGTGQGLFRYNLSGQLTNVVEVGSEVRALLIDRQGTLWVGTSGEGLVRYQNGVFTHLNKVDGLASDFVTSLFEDAEGSLWVGTRDGLSQLTDLKFPTYSVKSGLVIVVVDAGLPAGHGEHLLDLLRKKTRAAHARAPIGFVQLPVPHGTDMVKHLFFAVGEMYLQPFLEHRCHRIGQANDGVPCRHRPGFGGGLEDGRHLMVRKPRNNRRDIDAH